jgi:hypothetical protein
MGENEMLGHWQTGTVPLRVEQVLQGVQHQAILGQRDGAAEAAHGKEGTAQAPQQ